MIGELRADMPITNNFYFFELANPTVVPWNFSALQCKRAM